MANLLPICVKTPKGIEEVERRTHGLNFKSRKLLILIDGKRDTAVLQEMFPAESVPVMLDELMSGGFIRRLENTAAPATAAAAVGTGEDPFVLGQTFMVNIAKTILGIAGDSVVAKLKAASDVAGLHALYPEWRNAIKQAPDGVARLKELDKKLFKVIGEVAESSAVPTVAKPGSPPKNDAERLELARNFMGNTARKFLGLAGSGLIEKIEKCAAIADLRALYFEWREALRQSPDAKLRMADFESRLAALLS